MSTFAELINRTYREYLRPVEEQEPLSQLASGIDNSASTTSITYVANLWTPEEEELIGSGSILEIGQELMMVEDINTVSRTITVERARLGSTIASHAADADILLKPRYPRLNVANAIGDQIVGLYPALYAVKNTTLTTTSVNYVEGPADMKRILKAKINNSTSSVTNYADISLELLTDFTPSSTNVAIQFPTGPTSGKSVYVNYAAQFTRPTAETDNLNTVSGLEEFHEQIVMVGAVAQMLSELDVDTTTQNFITESLEIRGVPLGSGERVRNALLRYYGVLLDRARREQRTRFPAGVDLYGISFTT
jgi:hypothetical protein